MRTIQSEFEKLGYRSSKRKRKKKRNKSLSKHELNDLMGVNRPTYRRGSGGSWRQR